MSMVATAVLLLLQVPPVLPPVIKSVITAPTHTVELPLIVPALSTGLTVMGADALTDAAAAGNRIGNGGIACRYPGNHTRGGIH